ncbi:hypothetical protein [Kitasatospora cineracea]|uniref:hypothetical protein n=1 Tax=Kitasatospora cineracea TaxID=88074 RepID=UPI00382FB943
MQPSTETPRSDLGSRYVDHLAGTGQDVAALTAAATGSELLAVAYRGRFLPAPVFLSAAERALLAEDLRTVHALLTGLPERLFGGSTTALAEAVGMNATQAAVVARAAAAGPLLPMARSDLYRDATGFKLLELNITSALGGFENADINRAMLDHPALAGFAAAHRLQYADTLRCITDTMLAECAAQVPADRPPVVALVDWPESYLTYRPRLGVLADLLGRAGLRALPCHIGQLAEKDGRLTLDGEQIDIVWRFFLVEEIVDEEGAALVEPVLRAAENGTVGVFSRLDAELYGNKGALALLSDDRHRDAFTPAEQACIDRFLPWTRPVLPTVTGPDGAPLDLLAHARAEQRELILKPTLLHGGTGIVPGWTVTAEEWQERLAEAVGGPYVLQRRVHPQAEAFPTEDGSGTQRLYLNWGVFLADPAATGTDGYAGCIVRGSLDPAVGVVSMGSGARVGCCFHQPGNEN